MNQPFSSHHWNNSEGNPAGGTSFGPGFAISWQNGPLGRGENRNEPNGAFVETIIQAAIDRLSFYQRSQFACASNEVAIRRLQEGLRTLEARTRDREERGVEGTHQV